jgi:hypothetical protein
MQIHELFVLGAKHKIQAIIYIQVSQEEWSIFWEVIVTDILSKNSVYVRVLFWTVSEVSLYSCKIVDKKEILRTVSNAGFYCSSDKFGTVYLVQYIFENSTVNINVPCNSCEDMACCWSGCTLTFLYAGDNHYVMKQFVFCIHFSSVHFTLHPTP